MFYNIFCVLISDNLSFKNLTQHLSKESYLSDLIYHLKKCVFSIETAKKQPKNSQKTAKKIKMILNFINFEFNFKVIYFDDLHKELELKF